VIVTDKTVGCDFCESTWEYKPTEMSNTAINKELRENGWQLTKKGDHRCPSCVEVLKGDRDYAASGAHDA
jgi:hypothetical protein